jgi:DNA modification methylase
MDRWLNQIIQGDCLKVMRGIPDDYIDSIVTDPPYELGFMGKKWDNSGIAYNVNVWKHCLRVLKPGGHLLSFGGTRTYHRMACAIEDAGFEIRDQIQWIYGSGFPKSMGISKAIDKQAGVEKASLGKIKRAVNPKGYKTDGIKQSGGAFKKEYDITDPATLKAKQWDGWGTALKPAHEPIVVARKPLSEKTIAENVMKWGTGGLNIDGCRIPTEDNLNGGAYAKNSLKPENTFFPGLNRDGGAGEYKQPTGRFPANVILDEEAGKLLDEQSRISKSTGGSGEKSRGASRFFYCAKASKKERGEYNTHPTVKPLALMRYLVRLITPPGGIVLDPFTGSGTTLIASKLEGFFYLGIEREQQYCEIARQRV